MGCFHFLKSGTAAGTATGAGGGAAAAIADADARLGGGSLGNSPAVGRKKLSLDSQFVVAVQVTTPSPTAQVGGGGGDGGKNNNNTYDRAFYRDLAKKLFASSERVNSKSSGDLTMYNSASRLTEARAVGEYDYDGYQHEEDDEDVDIDGRFQRNASGSQFPRHCFFRQQQEQQEEQDEDEDEERQINSHCSSEHSSSTADNSGTSRTGVVPRKSSVTFQISTRGGGGGNVETPLSPQQTSIASISFATTNYSSSEEAAADDDIDDIDEQQRSDNDNDDDSGHHRLQQGNSIMYTRRMLDVQPHPDVIKMNEKYAEQLQQQQLQLQQQQQQQLRQQQQQQQQHSSSGKFKSLMSLFTRNSKKKYTKLFDHQLGHTAGGTLDAVGGRGSGSIAGFSAIDPYEASECYKANGNGNSRTGGRGGKRKCKKQQTQSCEQLERVWEGELVHVFVVMWLLCSPCGQDNHPNQTTTTATATTTTIA